ncbi:TRAP transporter small permease [Balneatrix alpica]|uniref:TRAP transporter small permease protein n=1 Tax=Balneatrix alpica TaxID=75684 RepID=A0ABV5ZD28_9GAMM|nr:TRAP transporter small permease subunit [Balneatrix alpica]
MHALNNLYRFSGALAALNLCAIMGLILLQVLGRVWDKLLSLIGQQPWGLHIPGLAEITGFMLLTATFAGLSYTFRVGGHIRVTLLIQRLGWLWRRRLELLILAIALALSLYACWFALTLTLESYQFNDVSIGMVPILLWIPQSLMTLGLALLSLALAHTWVEVWQGDFHTLELSGHQE